MQLMTSSATKTSSIELSIPKLNGSIQIKKNVTLTAHLIITFIKDIFIHLLYKYYLKQSLHLLAALMFYDLPQ